MKIWESKIIEYTVIIKVQTELWERQLVLKEPKEKLMPYDDDTSTSTSKSI